MKPRTQLLGGSMRVESVRIQNLRAFSDQLVPFNNYTCLVGPNGAGKSTVLCALNIFFRETANSTTDLTQLSAEDFHQRDTKTPIQITVTFVDLSEEAQADFADYYRQGKLIVTAIAMYSDATGRAEVRQMGQRLAMPAFREFFKALGDRVPVAKLKDHFSDIRSKMPDVPAATTKDAMVAALRAYESEHPDKLELTTSEDQFYGVSKGADRLGRYLQWVYVPAVKDVTSEQIEGRNTALGKLLARTVRAKLDFDQDIKQVRDAAQIAYQKLLETSQSTLDDLSKALGRRLSEWAHPNATIRLEWHQEPDRSVRIEEPFARIIAGEGDFEGELSRFGHGLQRSYLLALLQELANTDDSKGPRLVLGCEEPELYQHPPQARHLATVLQKLSHANSQVIVSTHSPVFVSGEGFEDVRLVRRHLEKKFSHVAHMTYEDIAKSVAAATGTQPVRPEGALARIHQALQPALNEMFFSSRLVLVEGIEDLAYLTSYIQLMGKWDEYRRVGCHIVPVGRKSDMLQPLVIAKHLGIPTLVLFDGDTDKINTPERKALHERDNRALLKLAGGVDQDPFSPKTLWGKGFVMWTTDLATIVAADIGQDHWAAAQQKADLQYGQVGNLKKNMLHIGYKLAFSWDDGKRSAQLEQLCNTILDVGNSV